MSLPDSPFVAPRSHLNPNAFRVQQPANLLSNSSPKRLPTSRSSNQASKALRISCEDDDSAQTAPNLESPATAAGRMCVIREKQSVSRSLQRQRPSVADLRESFERISRPAEKDGGPRTPVKLRTSMSTSICYTNSKSIDCSLGDTHESSRRPVTTPCHSPGRRIESTTSPVIPTGADFNTKPSVCLKQGLPSRSYPALPNRIPLALPTSKSSRSRLGMLVKAKAETQSSREGKKRDLYMQPTGVNKTKANRHSGNDFPHSSPAHPLLLSTTETTKITDKGGRRDLIDERMSLLNTTLPDPNCWIEEFSTDVDLSLSAEGHSAAECGGQRSHRPSRVADLRRLFDRSSPRPLVAFRRQRQTLPNLELLRLNLERDEGLKTPSFMSPSSTSQKACTPPALTTEIGTNDFSCRFLDGDAAHLYTSSPAKPKSRRDLPPATLPRISCESFLQQRIIKFEQMNSQSEPENLNIRGCQSHRREYTVTTDSSPLDTPAPVPVAPKSGHKGHPVRSVWRRISNSFTQSFDGSDSYSRIQGRSRYHSSYQESSHDYAGSPPPQSPLLPLRASRKSLPLLQRLSSRGRKQISGLDGANHSSASTEISAPSAMENRNLSRVGSHGSTQYPEKKEPRELGDTQTDHKAQKKAKKRAEKLEKQERRERRRWRHMEKDPENRKPLSVPRASSGTTATLEVPSGNAKDQERSWGKQTSSGFVVRQAFLGSQELAHPRPDRPGQVRKIVDLYKEKSSSMLRMASGRLSVGRGRIHNGGSEAKGEPKGKYGEAGSTDR